MLMTLLPVPWHHPFATRQLRLTHRNRKFVDSPLEGNGFELPVRGRGQSDCRHFVQPAAFDRDPNHTGTKAAARYQALSALSLAP
jgi:hypothetical protein